MENEKSSGVEQRPISTRLTPIISNAYLTIWESSTEEGLQSIPRKAEEIFWLFFFIENYFFVF